MKGQKPRCHSFDVDVNGMCQLRAQTFVLVEIPVARQELSMPPTITSEEARGFSLFMAKGRVPPSPLKSLFCWG